MNASTYSWEVQIQGDQFDLEHLARHFESSDVSVSKSDRDDCYVLRADQFAACASSEEVLSAAEDELAIISGVLKLVIESRQPLHAGTAYKIHADGRREIFVHISETLVLRDECEATLIDAQGNVVVPSVTLSRTTAIAAIAKTDSAVAKTMRLLAAHDAATWVHASWGQVFHYHIANLILSEPWPDPSDSNSPARSITSPRAAMDAKIST